MQLFIDTLINSAMASSASALVVVGLALIFGVMRVENFAHGELYMVGAYATWFVGMSLGWGYWAGFLAAIAVTAVIGMLMELLLFRRLRGNPMGALIITVGVLLVLQTAVAWLFGINGNQQVLNSFTEIRIVLSYYIP